MSQTPNPKESDLYFEQTFKKVLHDYYTKKGKTMNEVAPNNTPATVDLHTEVDDLPDFLKQAIKDGKPVEIQTDEEIGEVPQTLN